MRNCHHKILLLQKTIVLTLSFGVCSGQSAEIGVFGGLSNYLGELTNQYFTPSNAGSVAGLNFKYPLNGHFYLRGSVAQGNLSGYDRDNSPDLKARNLSFQTKLTDGYIAAEYRVWTSGQSAVTPYFFGGLGIFHFNPYVIFGDKNEKVYLQPLGTEGQGLPEYPERKMYNLTDLVIPFGGGVLWTVNERWLLGIEFRQNYTFTDYLDDVSNRYALPAPLLRDRGPLAVELAWRRDEYDGRPYPNNEGRRGNPDNNDWYYYLGLHAGFSLFGNTENNSGKKSRKQLGCPRW